MFRNKRSFSQKNPLKLSLIPNTFACKNIDNLISVPIQIRRDLLMNYKFLFQPDARLCSNHIGVSNYWPLVKQVSNEDHKMMSDESYVWILSRAQ